MNNTAFYNTDFGKISLSHLWTTTDGEEAYECYDEYDKCYGIITFNLNDAINDNTVNAKLKKVRLGDCIQNYVKEDKPFIGHIKVGVDWDTDTLSPMELGLPEVVEVPSDIDEDDIADWLSDEYGFCVNSFNIISQ